MQLGPTQRRYVVTGVMLVLAVAAALAGYFALAPRLSQEEEVLRRASAVGGRVAVFDETGPGQTSINVRVMEIQTGRVVRLSDDPAAAMVRGTVLSFGPGKLTAGYLALIEVGRDGTTPLYDAVLVRFSDMKRFVLAQQIVSLDRPLMRRDDRLTAVIWDRHGQGRETMFDLAGGRAVPQHAVDRPPPPLRAAATEPTSGRELRRAIY